MYADKGKKDIIISILNSTVSWKVQRDDEHSLFKMPFGI